MAREFEPKEKENLREYSLQDLITYLDTVIEESARQLGEDEIRAMDGLIPITPLDESIKQYISASQSDAFGEIVEATIERHPNPTKGLRVKIVNTERKTYWF